MYIGPWQEYRLAQAQRRNHGPRRTGALGAAGGGIVGIGGVKGGHVTADAFRETLRATLSEADADALEHALSRLVPGQTANSSPPLVPAKDTRWQGRGRGEGRPSRGLAAQAKGQDWGWAGGGKKRPREWSRGPKLVLPTDDVSGSCSVAAPASRGSASSPRSTLSEPVLMGAVVGRKPGTPLHPADQEYVILSSRSARQRLSSQGSAQSIQSSLLSSGQSEMCESFSSGPGGGAGGGQANTGAYDSARATSMLRALNSAKAREQPARRSLRKGRKKPAEGPTAMQAKVREIGRMKSLYTSQAAAATATAAADTEDDGTAVAASGPTNEEDGTVTCTASKAAGAAGGAPASPAVVAIPDMDLDLESLRLVEKYFLTSDYDPVVPSAPPSLAPVSPAPVAEAHSALAPQRAVEAPASTVTATVGNTQEQPEALSIDDLMRWTSTLEV